MAKILLALHSFFPRFYTGTETLTLEVAKSLCAQGHSVVILTAEPRFPEDPYLSSPEIVRDSYDGIPVWRMSLGQDPTQEELLDRESYDARLIPFFRRVIAEEKPDIVHAFHLMRLTLSFVEVVKSEGIPFYFTTTDFWLLCQNYQMIRPDGTLCSSPDPVKCFKCVLDAAVESLPTPSWKLRLGLRFPSLALLVSPLARQSLKYLTLRIERHRKLMGLVDTVFWSTPFLQKIFTENGLIPKDGKVVSFPVPEQASELFDLPPLEPNNELRVAFIGTLRSSKGPQVAIEALQKINPHKPIRLYIWGAESKAGFLKKLQGLASGDKRIAFKGTFPQKEFSQVLKDTDVVVIPSLWYENTPLTALSVLAARRVLVVSDLGGLTSLVNNGATGFTFKPGDAEELALIFERLADDRALLASIAEKSITPSCVNDYVKQLIEVYSVAQEGENQ